MTPTGMLTIGALALLATYPIFFLVWLSVMRPIRMRFADEGVRLLKSKKLDDQQKALVDRFLDDAFDWKFAIFAFVAFLPTLAWKVSLRRLGHGEDLRIPGLRELHANPEADEFLMLHAKCALGSNPFFALLFFIEALAVFAVAAVLYRSLRHAFDYIEQSIGWLAAKVELGHAHAR